MIGSYARRRRRRLYVVILSSSATHSAIIASCRPTGPTCSPVFAFTPTHSGGTCSKAPMLRRIASLCGESFGSWANTMQSTFTTRHPAATTRSIASRSMSAESRPRFSGALSGNISPISPNAAAPNKASVTACSRTSASLCPTSPWSWGMSTPPSRSGKPGPRRWVSCPIPIRTASVIRFLRGCV